MTRVKICGLTNLEDALAAVAAGADALGFVLAPSPRRVTPDQARAIIRRLPPLVATVGVFVDEPVREVARLKAWCGLDWAQLHGQETPEEVEALSPRIIKALAVGRLAPDPQAYPEALLLLDTALAGRTGGTGQAFDWGLAVDLARQRPIILAGGLHPGNVAQAISTVKPFAVDVSSGVEREPGRKDHAKIRSFVARAKGLA
ncbi:MAG: phosphoribosylanthranilate isomerase [Desulfarculus sp.]|nr:phosphoribosylanthranilate isomerase [Desulfarculus sp.]